jgi:hypothetical protein
MLRSSPLEQQTRWTGTFIRASMIEAEAWRITRVTAPRGYSLRLSNHTLVHRRFDRITGAQLRDGDGDRQGSVGLVDGMSGHLRISDSEGDGVVTSLLRGS